MITRIIYLIFTFTFVMYAKNFNKNTHHSENFENTMKRIFTTQGKILPSAVYAKKHQDKKNMMHLELHFQLNKNKSIYSYDKPMDIYLTINTRTGVVNKIVLEDFGQRYDLKVISKNYTHGTVTKFKKTYLKAEDNSMLRSCLKKNLENQFVRNPIEKCGLEISQPPPIFSRISFNNNKLSLYCRPRTKMLFHSLREEEVYTIYGEKLLKITLFFAKNTNSIDVYISNADSKNTHKSSWKIESIDGIDSLNTNTQKCVREIFGNIANRKQFEDYFPLVYSVDRVTKEKKKPTMKSEDLAPHFRF